MRNSLLAAMLIAFGSTVAMPAMAAQKIEHPQMQHQKMRHQQMQHQQTQKNVGKGVTTGSTAKPAPTKSRY